MQWIGDEIFQACTDLVDDFIWNGEYDKVPADRQLVARMRDAPIRAKYVKAKSLFRMGKRDEALEWINAEMQLDPNVSGERSILTIILGEMCYLDEMLEPDEHLLSTHLHGALFREFLHDRVDRKVRLEEKAGIAIFMAGIQKNDAGAYAKLAKILNYMEERSYALKVIDKALDLDSLNVTYRYIRAEVLRGLGRRRDCDRGIKGALALDMYHTETVAFSGYRLCEKGYVNKGRIRIDFAYAKDSLNPVTCYYKAYVLLRDGDRIGALDVCKSAMLRHPEDHKLLLLLVTILDDVLEP